MRRRFGVEPYHDGSQKGYMRCAVVDGDEVVFEAGEWKEGDYAHLDRLEEACKRWLNDTRPDWRNPLAYW